MLDQWLLVVFGFLIGIIASMTGVGGGTFIVPILTILYSFSPPNAVGTSLTSIIFTAAAATVNYIRQRRIYFRTGLVLAIATVPGAYLGAWLTTIIQPNVLGLIFGFFLIFVAARMIINPDDFRRKDRDSQNSDRPKPKSDLELLKSGKVITIGAALSFFGGLSSGLLGIGGGVLLVPIMTFAMTIPIHFATATSMFTMIFTSISGVVQHYQANHIDFEYGLLLALGTIFGAQVGAFVSKKVSGKNLRRIFGLMLIVVGLKMITQYMP